MTSRIVVNNIQADAGVSTVTFGSNISGNFVGNVTGTVNSSGIATFSSGPVIIGSGTSTGTASQRIQVTGGGYISDSLGVGVTNLSEKLRVGDSAATSTTARANILARFQSNGSNADATIQLSNNVDHSGTIGIAGGANMHFGVDGVEAARITSGGNVEIANGNLVFSTSGKGIDFSATANSSGTMTSELLNDYEEGTWTPIASASTGTITSYTSSGRYTKIGRQVIVKFSISISNQGTASGQYLIFSGLPFLSSNTWTNVGVCREQNVNGLLSTAQIGGNTTNGSILRYDNSGVIVNGTFQCTICYDVD